MVKRIGDTRTFLAIPGPLRQPLQRVAPAAMRHQRAPYIDPPGLFGALNTAILLGLPLLITGEPGTGKTQAAYWLSDFLGENEGYDRPQLLRTDVKSTSTGRDLLYRFDEVARFRDSAAGGTPRPLIEYIEFEALGEAIIRAAGSAAQLTVLGSRDAGEVAGRAFGHADGALSAASLLPGDPTFAAAQPSSRVVLIDELDKAPRDTPNDLLAEIENMAFAIPELGLRIDAAPGGQRPITIITSNSERDLPEPFLRRCAFFHIPFPDEAQIREIVASSVEGMGDPKTPLLQSSTSYLLQLREDARLSKRPGTAEFLAWCVCLAGQIVGLPRTARLEDTVDPGKRERLLQSLGCLVKTRDDLTIATSLMTSRLPEIA